MFYYSPNHAILVHIGRVRQRKGRNSAVKSSQLSWAGQYNKCVQYDFQYTSEYSVILTSRGVPMEPALKSQGCIFLEKRAFLLSQGLVRNDCRILHSGISISKKERRRKLLRFNLGTTVCIQNYCRNALDRKFKI